MPDIILQFSKRMMKKKFEVNLDFCDDETYQISFQPKDQLNTSFHGQIWIDRDNSFIRKIHLEIKDTQQHPFVNVENKKIKDISCSITKVFKDNDTYLFVDHTLFNISFNCLDINFNNVYGDSPFYQKRLDISSLLYFYDEGDPFILPYFEYDNKYRDYRKLSMIPYNEVFWENKKLLLSQHQKKQLGVFENDGILINYDNEDFGIDFIAEFYQWKTGHFYENYYHIFWSHKKRVVLKPEFMDMQRESMKMENLRQPRYTYHFKVQIFLDINPVDSTFDCKSFTIFDQTKSFYYLQVNPLSNAFLNIYFDICEIERRKMDLKLQNKNLILDEINDIYNETLFEIDLITNQYLKEVQKGENIISMQKWNAYVVERLGIDNISMFQLAE